MKTRESGMPEETLWQGFFKPETVVKKLGLTSGCENVVDFGCGYGTFTIPAARIASGVVYALDIEPERVEVARCKAEEACLKNVEVWQRDFVVEGLGLPDGSVDYVMLFNILHAEERMMLLQEAWPAFPHLQITPDTLESNHGKVHRHLRPRLQSSTRHPQPRPRLEALD